MVPDVHHDTPFRYGRIFRQLLGVCCIAVLTFSAWALATLPLPASQALSLGYGLGLMCFLAGAYLATRGMPPGKTLLGGGMAYLFFATHLGAYMLTVRTSAAAFPGVLAGLLLLVLFAAMAWRARSQSAALLTLALGIFFLRYAVRDLSDPYGLLLFVLTAGLGAAWSGAWALRLPGRLFPKMAQFVLYAGYLYIGQRLLGRAPEHGSFLAAALTGLYVLLLLPPLVQGLSGRYAPAGVRVTGIVSTALFFSVALFLLVRADLPLWPAPAAVAVVSAIAVVLLCRGGRDSALLPLYMTQAVFGLVLAVALPLPAAPRFIAFAGLCAAPAVLGRWRPHRVPRLCEYLLLAAAAALSFLIEAPHRFVLLGPVGIPVFWAQLLSALALLVLLARLHEDWARTEAVPARGRAQELLALACACVAAVLLTVHTILKRGDSELLPLVLSVQGMVFLGLGMAMASSLLTWAGLIPVFAAHACYYAYPLLTTAAVVWELRMVQAMLIVTAILALACDSRFRDRGMPWTAALPYLPMPLLIVHYLHADMPLLYVTPLLLAVALPIGALAPSLYARLPGLVGAGYGTAILAAGCYLYALLTLPVYRYGWHVPLLALSLALAIGMERHGGHTLWLDWRRRQVLSWLLVLAMAVTGAFALYRWNNGAVYIPALLSLALLFGVSGWLYCVRAYYVAAASLVVCAVGWGARLALFW